MVKALELFCGIGGFAAAALGLNIKVCAALDQSPAALTVYRTNFPDHPAVLVNLEGVKGEDLVSYGADLWWMSPPCQPYGVRGGQRDVADTRARSLIRILDLLARLRENILPEHFALENVSGFAGSKAQERLIAFFSERRYRMRDCILCPTELGIPSRRPRYYFMASRQDMNLFDLERTADPRSLKEYLDSAMPEPLLDLLRIPPETLERFGSGFSILDPNDPAAYTTCFTSGYGKSLMHSGSYLCIEGGGVRRFSPREIALLLHFPPSFRFPEEMPLRKRWELLGNSLSVTAAREILKVFPALHPGA